MNSPFFILGNPRSGTSLFRLMLNSHPMMIVPPECGFVHWWFNKYKDWSEVDVNTKQRIEEYVEDVLSSKKIEEWSLNKQLLIDEISSIKPLTYQELSMIVYKSYSSKRNSLVGDKNNYFIHHLEELKQIFPSTKYIHLVRDGRDVACSYKGINQLKTNSSYIPKVSNEITQIAEEWKTNLNNITRFLASEHHIVIKYEDLLTHPVDVLSQVCEFLKIPFDSKMLDYYKEEHHDEPKSTIDWKRKTLEKIDGSNFNKYHKILTRDEIDIFNRLAQKELQQFGYAF